MPLDETFLAQNMGDAGYHTALFGKVRTPACSHSLRAASSPLALALSREGCWVQWHLGFYQRAYTPLARGFDEHVGYFQGAVDYYAHTGGKRYFPGAEGGVDWHRGNQSVCYGDNGTYVEELLVPETLGFFKRMAKMPEKPWFLCACMPFAPAPPATSHALCALLRTRH